ncbi:MAG TPA: 23S rRNA pseudouridine(1911/1915/1917) synthase RluD, partial [Burkholderiales bacterium]|nr:23S rRNA pseudouridine(1911/1915/1917) synthase RluD [Burkholderiales bacterium]
RLDQTLARLLPEHSRSRLTQWIRDSRVVMEGHGAQPSDKVWGGEVIAITPTVDPVSRTHLPQAIALNIVHEDDAIIVINKPAGLVVHPGSGNPDGTMLNALLQHAPALTNVPRAGIVHRLDKDTSGLLVVAKTLTAQTDLVRQLQARTVRREYAAIVMGIIERDGKIEAPIGRHPISRTRMAVVARGKPALTHYEVIEIFENATWLLCRLETGRTHQIRVHLASIGHPLIGDPVYGKRPANRGLAPFNRQALHAQKLGLVHPVTRKRLSWKAPLPPDMCELIERLSAR